MQHVESPNWCPCKACNIGTPNKNIELGKTPPPEIADEIAESIAYCERVENGEEEPNMCYFGEQTENK